MTKRLQTDKTRYALVVNTRSRQGARYFREAKKRLAEATGAEVILAHGVRNPHRLPAVLKAAAEAKPDVVIIGGGDGTVCETLHYVIDTPIVCALLPLGTTNNFARSLGLPLDFEGAIHTALTGGSKNFDVGQVGNRYFANVVSIGLSSRIALHVSDRLKKTLGRMAYGLTGIQELFRHRAMDCTVLANGETHRFTTHQLVIANGNHHGAVEISRRASPADGQLVLFTMDDGSRWRLIRNVVAFSMHGLKGLKATEIIRTQSLQLSIVPQRRIEVDGERGERTPLTIRCLPGAVRFRVPATEG